jgi:membrane-associated protein
VSEWLADLLDPDLATMTAGAVYAIVWTLVFAESGLLFGFFLPGDTVLFTAGLISAEPRSGVSLPLLVAGTLVAAVAGDALGYWCGRRLGRPWLLRRAGRAARHVQRAEQFYERYGWWAVVVARWIPWVRTFTPIVAGVAQMSYPRFLAANVVGALCWGAGLVVLGHVAHAVTWVRYAAYAVAAVAVTASLVGPLVARARSRSRGQLSPRSSLE